LCITILAMLVRLVVAPLLAAIVVGTSHAAPDPTAPGLDPAERVEALVERVTAAQRATRSLRAEFVQRRESELLLSPEEARGTFSFVAPDRVRWEYRTPRPMTVVVRGEEMTTWYRDLGRAEKANVGKYSNQVLRYLGASGSFESLRQYFDVAFVFPQSSTEPYRVELKPRFANVARRIGGMTIWIDRSTYLASRVRIADADGDTTEFTFTEVALNPDLDADLFTLRLPPDIEVKVVAVGPKAKGPGR
jgi:outer membrane lipoprotein-sorting protein